MSHLINDIATARTMVARKFRSLPRLNQSDASHCTKRRGRRYVGDRARRYGRRRRSAAIVSMVWSIRDLVEFHDLDHFELANWTEKLAILFLDKIYL